MYSAKPRDTTGEFLQVLFLAPMLRTSSADALDRLMARYARVLDMPPTCCQTNLTRILSGLEVPTAMVGPALC